MTAQFRFVSHSLCAAAGVLLAVSAIWSQAPAPAAPKALDNAKAKAKGPGQPLSPLAPPLILVNQPNPLDRLTPVTEQMLSSPPAGDWLTWRREYNGSGFSPLTQINKTNVRDMRVAWTWALPSGSTENTPLVHEGVLFIHGVGDKIQAIDAARGNLLWEYVHEQTGRGGSRRNHALYDDKVVISASDGRVVVLSAKTGQVIWNREVIPGARLGGPLVAAGKVMVGTTGRTPGGNLIVALDLATGNEAWRFHTIAQEGQPGGETWNGLTNEQRNGASVWVTGSYDVNRHLAYFGIAQTYDTGPLMKVTKAGVTNDALYTDTTVALDPDTGQLKWYFQHLPNDQWDLDWAFERIVLTLEVNGQPKQLVLTGGKQGLYDAVDAATGQYAFSFDLGLQNVVSSVDPRTGAKTINPATVPGPDRTVMVCPHAGGGKSWMPGSYNPESKVLFTGMVETCMDLIPVPPGGRGGLSSGVNWGLRPRPDSDGNYGRVQAVNVQTREVLWTSRHRAPESAGTLATAGGLVFSGSIDRVVRAHDDANGNVLWEMKLNDVPNSAPISYTANGKQYIAMVVGGGGAQANSFVALVPEIANPSDRGATLWVFEVPTPAVP